MNPTSADMGDDRSVPIYSPADFPQNCRVYSITPGRSERTRSILASVRPDITFLDTAAVLTTGDWLLASGSDFAAEIRDAREAGLSQNVMVLPQVETSYYDFWSFPENLLRRSSSGRLSLDRQDFIKFVADLGDFFGRTVDGIHQPDLQRYQPLNRCSLPEGRSLVEAVSSVLGDDASRDDYNTVLNAEPEELWRHWLMGLCNGLEYMDYATVEKGNVVINCGVHGGGEIPYFLSGLKGQGVILNADPLGHTYLSHYTRSAIAGSSVVCHELCAAVSDHNGSIEMTVEPVGMAHNAAAAQPHFEMRTFRAATIDSIVEEYGLDRVDLIKMDIEGAEPQALSGSLATIERLRPQLAISIYHAPEHFVELPAMLIERLEDYRFFVRNYHFICNETIFYAIPKERQPRPRNKRIAIDLL